MRSKASNRSSSNASASARDLDEDDRPKKRVRWDPKSDDGMRKVTASDDSEGVDEEHSTVSDNEKVRLVLHHRSVSYTSLPRGPFTDLSCD